MLKLKIFVSSESDPETKLYDVLGYLLMFFLLQSGTHFLLIFSVVYFALLYVFGIGNH